MLRTLTRHVCRCLAAPAAFACCAANAYAQAAPKSAPAQADSGPFIGEFVLAVCAVGLILWAVCAPSGKAS